jgi:DNA-directed RNA polymerase specialized sigma24 family protein
MTSKSRVRGRSVRAHATASSKRNRLPLSADPCAEQKLVDGCVAGEERAWQELLVRYSDSLHLRIRAILGPRSRDANLVDEIAAEVWCTLFRKNGSLLGRFQANNGQPLNTFLGGVARIEVLRFLRSDHQRRCHELSPEIIQLAAESTDDDGYRLMTIGLGEFADALTPRQRQFLHDELLNGVKHVAQIKISTANRWQLQHRIRLKLLEFLNGHQDPK